MGDSRVAPSPTQEHRGRGQEQAPVEPCFICAGEGRIHDLDALPGLWWSADMTHECPICEGSGVEPEGDPS